MHACRPWRCVRFRAVTMKTRWKTRASETRLGTPPSVQSKWYWMRGRSFWLFAGLSVAVGVGAVSEADGMGLGRSKCSVGLTLLLSQLSRQRLPLSAEAARLLGKGRGGGVSGGIASAIAGKYYSISGNMASHFTACTSSPPLIPSITHTRNSSIKLTACVVYDISIAHAPKRRNTRSHLDD